MIGQYILLAVLVIITIINLYFHIWGKKVRLNNQSHLLILQNELNKKSEQILKENGLTVFSKHLFVSDSNEGFILIFDKENKKIVIVEKDNSHLFNSKDIIKCEKRIKSDTKKLYKATVSVETQFETFEYFLGTTNRKKNSIIGKFIIDNCDSFCSLINDFTSAEK